MGFVKANGIVLHHALDGNPAEGAGADIRTPMSALWLFSSALGG